MPTSELQGFLDDWQAKLKVLLGKNFQEAQNWLGQYMVNMADGYQRNYLKRLGLNDIPNMSAAQLDAAITRIRADRLAVMQSQADFDNAQISKCRPSCAAMPRPSSPRRALAMVVPAITRCKVPTGRRSSIRRRARSNRFM